MKKSVSIALCISLLLGCTIKGNEAANHPTNTYITDEMREHTQSGRWQTLSTKSLEPSSLVQMASDVAIVRVLTVDHADMKYAGFVPMTYGEMLVDLTLIGDVKAGSHISYGKPGGLVSIAEYETTDDPAAIAKREALREQVGLEIDKENTYYDILLGNDVEIIPGKAYLAYLDYHKDKQLYEIIGLGNGFREIDVPIKDDTPLDITNLHIKNNDTGEFESLQSYIDTYLK